MTSTVIIHCVAIIAVIAVVTLIIKLVPFIAFPPGKKMPDTIVFLGDILPYAIMGMLVIYCLRETNFITLGGWLPALISLVLVAVLHIWKRNMLLSILCGTVCYMLLIQQVFVV